MKINILSFLAFMITSLCVIAQSDSLNRFDSNNKKTGWWVVYLDQDLGTTDDTTKAVYYKYSYFEGKFDYFNMGRIGTKKNPVNAGVVNSSNGIIPLNGEYKANFNNGQTRYVLTANEGRLIEYREYYADGTLKTRFDYTESCGDTPFHYCIYQYNKDGSLKNKSTVQAPK